MTNVCQKNFVWPEKEFHWWRSSRKMCTMILLVTSNKKNTWNYKTQPQTYIHLSAWVIQVLTWNWKKRSACLNFIRFDIMWERSSVARYLDLCKTPWFLRSTLQDAKCSDFSVFISTFGTFMLVRQQWFSNIFLNLADLFLWVNLVTWASHK